MQGMERDPLHKLETGAIPIGQDRSPFVIPMHPSREFLDCLDRTIGEPTLSFSTLWRSKCK